MPLAYDGCLYSRSIFVLLRTGALLAVSGGLVGSTLTVIAFKSLLASLLLPPDLSPTAARYSMVDY